MQKDGGKKLARTTALHGTFVTVNLVRRVGYTLYWSTSILLSDAAMSSTTVKVSKTTVAELEVLREQLNARSLDEAVRLLIRKHRMDALLEALGADRGKIRPFTEEDRGEDR